MRILGACSLGGYGHLLPLLTVADVARDLGAELLIVAPEDLAQAVRERGYDVIAGDGPATAELAPIREILIGPDRELAAVAGNRDLFGRMAATKLMPAVVDAIERWKPDLIIRETCEYASAAVAVRRAVKELQVAIGLASIEWSSIELAEPALEELEPGLTAHVRQTPYLTGLPERLDPSPFPATIRFGPPPSGGVEPLPAWWGEGDPRPLCYVTFGSVLASMPIADQCFATVLKAVDGLECRVLLTTGRRFDPSRLRAVPRNVHVEKFVDQAGVFPEASIVVCHGGSGTTFGALAAGRPVVIIPMLADNARNGDLVAAHGAGVAVRRASGAAAGELTDRDVEPIRTAIEAVLADPNYTHRAQTISHDLATAPTLASVVAELLA